MLKSAVKNGILAEGAIYESVMSIKRAGADIIITYFAKDLAKMIRGYVPGVGEKIYNEFHATKRRCKCRSLYIISHSPLLVLLEEV